MPRLTSPITNVRVFVPRFVMMNVTVLPRTACAGRIPMREFVTVTLTVKIAGSFVVSGLENAGAASKSAAAHAPATFSACLIAKMLPATLRDWACRAWALMKELVSRQRSLSPSDA